MGHHSKDTNYPILRTTSNVDGTHFQTILDLIPGKPFGIQTNISQDDLAVCIDDHLGLSNWGSYVSIEPRINELKFTATDKLSFIPVNSHVTSRADARIIIRTTGASGDAWLPLMGP